MGSLRGEGPGSVKVASWHLAVIGALVALQAVALLAMGSPATCKCGHVALWYGNAAGPETSQQLTDWYSFTHVLHGVGFYFLLWLLAPRTSLGARLALAMGLEVGWEVLENTPLIIERYRQGGLAQGYFGDSILNSLGDTLAALVGFVLAWRLPVRASVALVVATEIFLAIAIRDNLTLNIVQLVHPSPALTRWQSGR